MTPDTPDFANRTTAPLPTYAPIPQDAFGPALNAQGYHVAHIDGALHWVTDGGYQAMFLATRDGVVLVDAPPSIGHNLHRAIADVTARTGTPGTVTHLVYSHAHADHIAAAGLFGEDVVRIGHVETARLLREYVDADRPIPTVTFSDRYTLEVGGERLELAYHGPNHTPDNIFIHVPDYDTLYVVDVLYPGWAPFQNLALSQDIPSWIDTGRRILDYEWTRFLGGHVGRIGTRDDAQLHVAYLEDLVAEATTVLHEMDATPYFQAYGAAGNAGAIMKHYWADAARAAAAPVVERYRDRLAAVDVCTEDNAFTVISSLIHDHNITGPAFGIHT
ncbi:MBL fold metallo-hydrolase [Brachybacterium saurashtrense]|uniref:MBL fold metallo-hydrolase n=1 Tax=Brachybacterium saurashtrense TaxID=556288 RepID=A0A345YLP8_9MICO|nr:MBL fold metallo-hydrolase [Brachybacterium saurashtrense]AXK44850.1 MBL fold metallo-hydrolase [Brachybacterium saurashtrense]RRR20741.1 MBL fold metallo-hydrolase [Brachybacterium saurashtrense]